MCPSSSQSPPQSSSIGIVVINTMRAESHRIDNDYNVCHVSYLIKCIIDNSKHVYNPFGNHKS